MSWYTPVLYAAIAYAIVWLSGLGGFPNHEFVDSLAARMGPRLSLAVATILYVLLTGAFGIARSLSTPPRKKSAGGDFWCLSYRRRWVSQGPL